MAKRPRDESHGREATVGSPDPAPGADQPPTRSAIDGSVGDWIAGDEWPDAGPSGSDAGPSARLESGSAGGEPARTPGIGPETTTEVRSRTNANLLRHRPGGPNPAKRQPDPENPDGPGLPQRRHRRSEHYAASTAKDLGEIFKVGAATIRVWLHRGRFVRAADADPKKAICSIVRLGLERGVIDPEDVLPQPELEALRRGRRAS